MAKSRRAALAAAAPQRSVLGAARWRAVACFVARAARHRIVIAYRRISQLFGAPLNALSAPRSGGASLKARRMAQRRRKGIDILIINRAAASAARRGDKMAWRNQARGKTIEAKKK